MRQYFYFMLLSFNFHSGHMESRSDNKVSLYSGNPRFKSQPGDWLYVIVGLSVPANQMLL